MCNENKLLSLMPDMLCDDELISALSCTPPYDKGIRNESKTVRLLALEQLSEIYIPSSMTLEIYSKLYLATRHSLAKKLSKASYIQRTENFKAIMQLNNSSVLGGADSFTIIGTSGVGKSTAVSKAIELISQNGLIELDDPYMKVIPCMVVQCPFDCSAKGLLFEILRKADALLGTDYYSTALRRKATIDVLIGSVSQIALNHIGLLVVDEIQNVVNNKFGKNLVSMLTQLINNSGISICMVGTPDVSDFLEQAVQLARRSLGLKYSRMSLNDDFLKLCHTFFSYQYTKHETELTPAIVSWLYEHSAGIAALVVSLIRDAQEIAILNGTEELSLETLREAYNRRCSTMHYYIETTKLQTLPATTQICKKVTSMAVQTVEPSDGDISIEYLAGVAKSAQTDIVPLLKKHFPVTEVRI